MIELEELALELERGRKRARWEDGRWAGSGTGTGTGPGDEPGENEFSGTQWTPDQQPWCGKGLMRTLYYSIFILGIRRYYGVYE